MLYKENDDLTTCFKNLPDTFSEDINIFSNTEPGPLVIYVEDDEDIVIKRLSSRMIGATPKNTLFQATFSCIVTYARSYVSFLLYDPPYKV